MAALAGGQGPEPPQLATATGRALVGILAAWRPAAAPPPPPPPPPPPAAEGLTGVCTHLAIGPLPPAAVVDSHIARYKAAGFQAIRDDLAWSWMEYTRGSIDFRRAKLICDSLVKHDMKLYCQIGFTPGWANGGAKMPNGQPNDKVGPLPAFIPAFAGFAGELAHWLSSTYPGLCIGIESHNEPNWVFLTNPSTGQWGDALYYVSLHNPVVDAVKDAAPEIPVVAGATAGLGFIVWDEPVMQWTEKALKAGLRFDEWACHPYEFGSGNMTGAQMTRLSDPTPFARALWDTRCESLAEQLARHGHPNVKIHFSEWGAPTHRKDGVQTYRGTSAQNQADLIRLGLALFKAHPRHGHSFFYCADDTDSFSDTQDMERHFGAWWSDLTPKPAVAAFKAAASL